MTKSNLERKGFISTYGSRSWSHHWGKVMVPSLRESHGRNWNKPWRNTDYWPIHWLMLSQLFYIPTCQGNGATHSGLGSFPPPPTYTLSMNTIYHRHDHRQSDQCCSSIKIPSSQVILHCKVAAWDPVITCMCGGNIWDPECDEEGDPKG